MNMAQNRKAAAAAAVEAVNAQVGGGNDVVATTGDAVAAAAKFPTDEQLRADGFDNLSKRIRELHRLGASTGEISRIVKRSNGMHPLYQHVRNVLNTPLKRA